MKDQFLLNFKDALEIEGREIAFTENFREFPEWDSIGQLSVIAMVDEEYGVVIDGKIFKELVTVDDLFNTIVGLQKG